jgi:hypothetical protein
VILGRGPKGKRELASLKTAFVLSLTLIALGGVAAIVEADYWAKRNSGPIPVILRDIGISIMVSVLVATFVELYTGRTLRSEVATDVIGATYKRFVPEAIYNEIADHVLKANVLREGWEIDLELVEPLVERNLYATARALSGQDIYLVDSTVNYQLTNISSQVVHYEVSGSIDLDTPLPEIAVPRFTEICIDGRSVLVGREIGEAVLQGEERRLETCLLHRAGGQVVFVQRRSIRPDGVVDVRFRLRRAFRAPGQLIYSATVPTRTMKLQIHGSPELEFELIALHPNKDGLRKVTNRQWRFDHGILPWQGFLLRAYPPGNSAIPGANDRGLWLVNPPNSR